MADRLLDRAVSTPPAKVEPDARKGGDIYAWAMRQAALLREGRFDEVDVVNVADEIEDVGKSDLRALRSNFENILMHMLKWDHQPSKRSRSWANSIFNGRLEAEQLLEDSPSFIGKRQQLIDESYERARRRAAHEAKLDILSFPAVCPYTWVDIMETRYDIADEQG